MKFSLFISLIVEWTYKQKQTYYVFKIRTYVRHEKKIFYVVYICISWEKEVPCGC